MHLFFGHCWLNVVKQKWRKKNVVLLQLSSWKFDIMMHACSELLEKPKTIQRRVESNQGKMCNKACSHKDRETAENFNQKTQSSFTTRLCLQPRCAQCRFHFSSLDWRKQQGYSTVQRYDITKSRIFILRFSFDSKCGHNVITNLCSHSLKDLYRHIATSKRAFWWHSHVDGLIDIRRTLHLSRTEA